MDSAASESVYPPPPLYRKPLNRSLLGALGKRPGARRDKPPVSLELERLIDRILPSASPVTSLVLPPSTPESALTSQNGSEALVEHTQSALTNGMEHSVAGTKGSSGSISTSAVAQTKGSEHSGTSTSHSTQKVKEGLEDPPPPGTGDQQIVWEPVAGGGNLWSYAGNWSTDTVPNDVADAVFTGQYNDECIVDVSTSEAKLILTVGPGGVPFNAPIEIQGGAALNIPAYDDSTDTGGEFNVVFLAANAPVTYNGEAVIQKVAIDYGTGGKVNIINGASLTLGTVGNVTQSSGSPINVTNGWLIFGDNQNRGAANYSTFNLITASADINIGKNGNCPSTKRELRPSIIP